MPQINTEEKQFESDIEVSFLEHGYVKIAPSSYDLEKNFFFGTLVEYIQSSQPKAWARYVKYYGAQAEEKLYRRLSNEIANRGVLDVLKKGIKDMGVSLRLCSFKPESELNAELVDEYRKNIFGVTRQWAYSKDNNNTVDMVLSLNGIPVIALELKDPLKNQDYQNAIEQWKNDRDPKEQAFRFDSRILAYFAVDPYQAWVATELKGQETVFVPFNQGSNGGGNPGGAGNPANPNGYSTSYLWERVLEKDSLLDLIQKFITVVTHKEEKITKNGERKVSTKQTLVFPRFHQYDVVKKVLADVKEQGAGTNYLINHSAGSGKSNSIAWLAYRLASVFGKDEKPIFNSVIVVTNRIVLDTQLQDTINSFDHTAGLVEAITSRKGSKGLKDAINDRKRIIICTIQKFLYAYKDFDDLRGRNFAIIIDEAHQGQSGESARTLRKSLIDKDKEFENYREDEGLTIDEVDENDELLNEIIAQGHHDNQSFFAFTATPNAKALELFGTISTATTICGLPNEVATQDANVKKVPFHTYSMRQAIEEGFILDVLQNYVTIKQAFRLAKTSQDNPELLEEKTSRALFQYYKGHDHTISEKVKILMDNFLNNGRYKINGHGKAMVVTSSRHNAVKYFFAIKDYIKQNPEKCDRTDVLVAFSGEVKFADDPQTYTEAGLNVDHNGHQINSDKKFRAAFRSDEFNIMVVANKYQTGYDEPYLHSMYVDKTLNGIAAVQTLSRLNRTCKGKTDTFVLDFENTADDIKASFQPFYENVELEGTTDINYPYDLLSKLKSYSLFSDDEVEKFYQTMMSAGENKKQDSKALGIVTSLLKPVADRYAELDFENRGKFRDTVLKFIRSYGFITQLFRIDDKELFKDYLFAYHLIRVLPKSKNDVIDITDKIKLEYASLKETFKGAIALDSQSGEVKPQGFKPNAGKAKKVDTLSRIIEKVNERWGTNFSDGDKVALDSVYNMLICDKEVLGNLKKYANDNNPDMFIKSIFPDKFREILVKCYMSNDEAFEKLLNNEGFQKSVMEIMAQEFYKVLKNGDK